MHGVEELGLLKMDFLGLRNLDVISDALEIIKATRGVDLDIDAIPLDDAETLALLCRGDSIGVFQLEGGPMRSLMRSLAPTSFEDVAALIALVPARPDGRQHAQRLRRPEERPQADRVLPPRRRGAPRRHLRPDDLPRARSCGWRSASPATAWPRPTASGRRWARSPARSWRRRRQAFVDGVEATGYGALLGTSLFATIEQFADYAFNKSHSFGYGFITFQTAYLKAHHPAEYLSRAAHEREGQPRQGGHLPVRVPHDGHRGARCPTSTGRCRTSRRSSSSETTAWSADRSPFGLSAVRNVGAGLVGLLLAEREANGPFADFYDFCERVDFQVLNKKTLESLIKAGAFDSLGHPRQGLLRAFEQIVDGTVSRRRERDMGVMSLFGEVDDAGPMFDERPPIPDVEFDKRERLSFEKEMLGPLRQRPPADGGRGLAAAQVRRRPHRPGRDGRRAVRTFGGVITGLQRKWTRKGDLMAVFALEDLQTAVEVMVFPKTMTDHGHKLADDAVVIVRARVDTREDQPKLIAMDVEPFEPMSGEAFPLRVKVAASTGVRGPDRRAEAAAQRVPGGLAGVPPPGRAAGPAPARRVDRGRGPSPAGAAPRAARAHRHPGLSAGPSALTRGSWTLSRVFAPLSNPCRVAPERRVYWTGAVATPSDPGAGKRMSIQIETKDCTTLGDAELAELADLCTEQPIPYEIGLLSKQAEAWVLTTQARENGKLKGFAFSTLERIGGTPSVLVGLASIKRCAKRDTVLRAIVHDQLRRAVLAFPDEDVLVRHPPRRPPRASRRSAPCTTSCPAPTTGPAARSGPGAGAWPSASASTRRPTTTAPSGPPATVRTPRCSTTRA